MELKRTFHKYALLLAAVLVGWFASLIIVVADLHRRVMSRTVPRECHGCGVACPPKYGIPDPCLGRLPGVWNACCGHGYRGLCYVMLDTGETLRRDEARAALLALGGSPVAFGEEEQPRKRGHLAGWDRAREEEQAA